MSAFAPPDWRDKSAYPDKFGDLDIFRWAWEFLRRNPDYQRDYEHFASLPSYYANGAKTCKWYGMGANWWNDPELRYCKKPLLPDEDTILDYYQRTKDDTPYQYSLGDHLIEKWGIQTTEIYDPAYDGGSICLCREPELPKVLNVYSPETHAELSELFPIETENIFEVTLRFDFRYSIEKQLNAAKEILLYYKEESLEKNIRKSSSVQLNKLPIYLRAYDGKQSGATYLDIGKVIFNGTDEETDKQRAHNAFKKASKLVNGGYQELIGKI